MLGYWLETRIGSDSMRRLCRSPSATPLSCSQVTAAESAYEILFLFFRVSLKQKCQKQIQQTLKTVSSEPHSELGTEN